MTKCRRQHLEALCVLRGYTLESVMPCVVAQDGDWWVVDQEHEAYPRMRAASVAKAAPRSSATPRAAPGTELKRLLKDWLGIEATPTCRCNSMAARMDALGVQWCESEAGMAEILGVMREEHARRRAAGQTVLPWTDFGAAQLVKLACRKAKTSVDTP